MTFIEKIDNFGHKMFKIGPYDIDVYAFLANFSTISNFLLGIYAIIGLLFSSYVYTDNYIIARLIVLGASFDAIDGKLARRSNTQPKLGAQLDTTADLFTFALAPASIILVMFYPVHPLLGMIFSGMYLFFASFRLSRFMIEPTTKTAGFFRGMPSPPAAIFIAGWYVQSNPNLYLAIGSILLVGGSMITSYPYTAMRTVKTKFQKINFIFTIFIMLLFTYGPNSWMEFLGVLWIINITYYTILGPIHANNTLV